MINVNIDGIKPFVSERELDYIGACRASEDTAAAGGAATGWVHLPERYDREELGRVKAAAERIRERADVFLVIGIGGSYFGSRAVIELIKSQRYNEICSGPKIYYLGNGITPDDIREILALAGDGEVYANVISKSGSTLEPALAFRFVRQYLEERYGKKEAASHIICTTDREHGALRRIAEEEGYESFTIPGDIGGRYSVLTPVGLLPMAVAGIDVDMLLEGAKRQMYVSLRHDRNDPAVIYAAARRALYEKGKVVEMLSYPGGRFEILSEWWKQLFAESEGKDGRGIFPAAMELTGGLHSMGQYLQQGRRMLQETVLWFEKPVARANVPTMSGETDGFDFVAGMDMQNISAKIVRAVMDAHMAGGVPCTLISADRVCEDSVGEILYFFQYACAISCKMLGVDPFDQPGVEDYKRNMFTLLGRG